MTPPEPEWAVAIFSARESVDTLVGSVKAAVRACGQVVAVVDVLVNGNPGLAKALLPYLAEMNDVAPSCTVRLWFIPMGDKGHAWNQFLHQIQLRAAVTFFIDGYVAVRDNAFLFLAGGLQKTPDAVAASGLPSSGRSAGALRARMMQHGGLHGNLFAVPRKTLSTLAERGFCLPLGIYRNDSLLATVFNYNLNPADNQVDIRRIVMQADATWDVLEHASPLWKKILTHLKRKVRQGQGDLENYALHTHFTVQRLRPEMLQRTSAELVMAWVDRHPQEFRELWHKNPLILHAFKKIAEPRDWTAAEQSASLLFSSAADTTPMPAKNFA